MKVIRLALCCLIGFFGLGVCSVLAMGAWHRSQAQAHPVSQPELQAARDAAVQWMLDHEGAILSDGNSALWLMLKVSSQISGDPRLASLVSRYMEQWMPPGKDVKGWRLVMEPQSGEPVDFQEMSKLKDHQQFFLYGLSCDERLLQQRGVQEHLRGDACPVPLLWALKDSTCSSHLMLGLRYVKERSCVPAPALSRVVDRSRRDIRQLLWWDFRVRDVYIQRALSLWWIGAAADVSPEVLTQIVRAQLRDGGWSDDHVLFKARDVYLAMGGPHGLTMEATPAEFHVTAQALLLLELALRDWPTYAQTLAKNNAP
jgi:hypothetical protein